MWNVILPFRHNENNKKRKKTTTKNRARGCNWKSTEATQKKESAAAFFISHLSCKFFLSLEFFFSFHTPPNQNTRAGYLCYFFLPRTHRKEQDLRRRRRWRRHTFVFMFVGFSSRFFFGRDFLQGFSWFSWGFFSFFFFAFWRLWIMNESVARGTCNGNMCEKPSCYCCEKCFPKDYYFKISQ